MKKLRVLGLAALLVVSTACGTTRYLKPDTTRQDFDRDYETCWGEAGQAGPPVAVTVLAALFFSPAAAVIGEHRMERTRDCMRTRGYTVGENSTGYQY
jgi:hypothetical protein